MYLMKGRGARLFAGRLALFYSTPKIYLRPSPRKIYEAAASVAVEYIFPLTFSPSTPIIVDEVEDRI